MAGRRRRIFSYLAGGFIGTWGIAINGERYLTAKQLAEILHVCVHTIRKYAKAGALPVRRLPGGGMRFRWEDVEALLDKE